MGYSVMFYGMNGQAFARQLGESPASLIAKVNERLGNEDEDRTRILQDICRGEYSKDCNPDCFLGLCWLADVASERITICPFQDFNHLSYLDEIGIWPWLQRFKAPFPAPQCTETTPAVGYLPASEIERFALPEFERLPASSDREVVNARDDFRDVLETLVRDRLDLLAVLVYSHA